MPHVILSMICLLLADPHPDAVVHRQPSPLSPDAVTHDWPSFLGPMGDGVSTETHLLKQWPEGGPSLVWEMKKGTGYASPAIAGDRLVMFHRVGDEEIVECLHRETAERYWRFAYPTTYRDRYGYNNGPRSSPVIHDGRVYTVGAQVKLHCFDLKTGEVLWQRNLAAEYKMKQGFFGYGSTPLVEGDLLIVNVGAPCVLALNRATGRTVWESGDQWGASYASPMIANLHGKRRILMFAGGDSRPAVGGLLSIDPADGAIDFRFPWRSTTYESVNASNPVVIGNQVFISASYQTGGAMLTVKPDGKCALKWKNTVGTHFNTPIHDKGYLYAFDGRNIPDASLVCVDVKTGHVVWRRSPMWDETVTQNGRQRTMRLGIFRGSLLKVDGNYLCLGEAGHLLWLDLSPAGYKQITRSRLFLAQETWSLPVLSRGLLYIAQHGRDMISGNGPRLLCYDLRRPS